MTDYNFEQDMTPEQVQLATEAGKLAQAHAKSVKLYEGLKIGESLLVGREVAMRLAGVNAPTGRAYSDHLLRWKLRFGFPTDRDFNGFCDAAIYCAQHRSVADAIIASLPVKRRAELGIQGLVKRVRERVREERGEPRKPPKTSPLTVMKHRLSETEGKLAGAEEKLAGDGTPRLTSALGSSMTGPDGGQFPGHGEREAMLTVFVDPFNRTISPFRIPSNPTPKLLLQIISGSRLLSASIAYETKVFWAERDDAEEDDPCFRLPGSPRLYSRALILGCRDGEFFDVPMPLQEAAKQVLWEGGRARPIKESVDAVRRPLVP